MTKVFHACICSFVMLWIWESDVPCRQLILTLYVEIRPREKEYRESRWKQESQWQRMGLNVCICASADVYSTCLRLFGCLVCDKCLVWLHLCVYVWVNVMGVHHLCVYMCLFVDMRVDVCEWSRNERQESHLLWCNDCAIWRQERFGVGAAGTSPGDLLAFLLSPSDRCVNSIISKAPE